jgi:hypothetical protein
MSAWWRLLVNETCSKLYIVGYIVVFYVLFTVHLGIIPVNNQLDAQFFFLMCLLQFSTFLISNFRRVLNIVFVLLGISPALDCDLPTFRNPLSVPSSKAVVNANMILFFVVYFCGIWTFSSSRKHLLITLLRLEFVVLVLYFSIYFYLCSFNYSLFLLFIFWFFSICEASLGLSILELTEGSETSENHNLTPGKYPKEYIQFSTCFEQHRVHHQEN